MNCKKLFDCLGSGNLFFSPFVVLKDTSRTVWEYECNWQPENKTARFSACCNPLFKDDLYLTFSEDGIICRRVFENISGKTLDVAELGIEFAGITFGGNPRDDYFYHNENPRIYEVMTFPVDYNRTAKDAKDSNFDFQAGNRWADPGVVSERIGASPYQPFPAILLSNYNTNHGLVHGTLSQNIFYHNYLISHENGKVKLGIFSSFKNIDALEVMPGRILIDEWYLGTTDDADDLEKIFEGYAKALRQKLSPLYGATDINRTSMVWGAWNDGIERNISETMLLEEAEFLKRNFPTVRWMQIDDGYAVYDKIAHGLGVPYEGEDGIDRKKFPAGLRHFTDRLREIGLRPAIWIGGMCPVETNIYQDHPDWFLDYSYRVTSTQPLDVSRPEVREYMTKALDTLCLKYGFEAVKHDFWSYAFEDSHDLYKNKDTSGYEYRRWWLTEMRKHIASDGYLQTGCDIVMGNPFLGEFFTNYRYGIDIGNGNWDYVKTNFLWGVACFATHTGDLFVPNSDSVGLFPGLNDTDAMFCINYCLVTHSMVEIAGKLSKATDLKRLKILKKAVCNPNNGQDVFFTNYDYRNKEYCVPKVLYFKTPHFTRLEGNEALPLRSVGIFNIEEHSKTIFFTASELGLPHSEYVITDVWSGEQFDLDGRFAVEVQPHGSRLLAISRKASTQLLDADIRVTDVFTKNSELHIEVSYGGQAELTFNRIPSSITFKNKNIDFKNVSGKIHVAIPSAGTLAIKFRE